MSEETIKITDEDLGKANKARFLTHANLRGFKVTQNVFFSERPDEPTTKPITLVGFEGESLESGDVASKIKSLFKQPVCISRFLTLGHLCRKIYRKHPIITFSSFWEKRGDIFVPCFWEDCKDLFPDFWSVKELWTSNCWFAVD